MRFQQAEKRNFEAIRNFPQDRDRGLTLPFSIWARRL